MAALGFYIHIVTIFIASVFVIVFVFYFLLRFFSRNFWSSAVIDDLQLIYASLVK